MLSIQNEREWQAFCTRVLEQPELARDERFVTNAKRSAARVELKALIDESFARFSAEQVVERLNAAQIANSRVNTMADVWNHRQLAARGRWVNVDTPAGSVPALLPPGAAMPGWTPCLHWAPTAKRFWPSSASAPTPSTNSSKAARCRAPSRGQNS